jgi:catechol 2,3-dioxygenase-like lactoylglutathione lyase family enzyme
MTWYLADLVLRVDGGVEISTCLVEAEGADAAYDKALALGADGEGELLGLHDLTEIQEPLGDGAEIAWQERPAADGERLVVRREELGLFRPTPSPAPPDLSPARIATIDHAQVMIPLGGEAEARRFYGELLGMREIEKPPLLRARGGLWMQAGDRQLHLGVEAPGVDRAATRAHVAYGVSRFDVFRARLEAAGVAVKDGETVDGARRFELRDPFGNRVELIEKTTGGAG